MRKEFHQTCWDEHVADDCRHLVRLAMREDLDQGYDWTTVALVPADGRGSATLVARERGVIAGLAAIPLILAEIDAVVEWTPDCPDGAAVEPGQRLGVLRGLARDLLTSERLILNLVGRLSGIASLTRQYVDRIAGTSAQVYDTRKTCPGYRRLEKYAVRCGGGRNHRTGLFDGILIKDNHLAFGATHQRDRFSPRIAVEEARSFLAATLPDRAGQMIIEIEVDSLEQFDDAIQAAPDIILLDNMRPERMREAVELRDRRAPEVQLEASGGVHLETILDIAKSGVERISVGALTHSARCLDVALDWEPGT
jgi:nicotinate-nucleotide pyrophosphorylase (carboxylating)